MNTFGNLKEAAWKWNIELSKSGLVVYTFGNLSIFDRKNKVFAIKPSGVPYESLKPEDIVIVDLNNTVVEGSLRPSSDTKTHSVLYRYFPEICSVVHTHSTYAVAWAQAMMPIPIYGTTHADHLAEDIPCTDGMDDAMIQGDYEEQTGMQIVKAFKNRSYKETEMILVASHGPFTWSKTPEKALYNSVILEKLAKIAAFTHLINPTTPRLSQTLIAKHYQRKHGKSAYYGQEKDTQTKK